MFDFGSQTPSVPNGSPVPSKKRKAASKEREPAPKGKMAKGDKPGPSGAASPRAAAPPKKRAASAKESGKTAEYYELKQGKFDTRFSINKNDPIND